MARAMAGRIVDGRFVICLFGRAFVINTPVLVGKGGDDGDRGFPHRMYRVARVSATAFVVTRGVCGLRETAVALHDRRACTCTCLIYIAGRRIGPDHRRPSSQHERVYQPGVSTCFFGLSGYRQKTRKSTDSTMVSYAILVRDKRTNLTRRECLF